MNRPPPHNKGAPTEPTARDFILRKIELRLGTNLDSGHHLGHFAALALDYGDTGATLLVVGTDGIVHCRASRRCRNSRAYLKDSADFVGAKALSTSLKNAK